MKWTKTFIPTLKEDPSDAEIPSHKLMIRAGLIRKLAAGLYTYLPLGLRSLTKAEQIVREEMNKSGAIEIAMPITQPSELWDESGRIQTFGADLIQYTDRHGKSLILSPTHEEVVTDLVRNHISSYKQLPVNLYQIQPKFRDEIRPRFGVLRSKEFLMKDAYSFEKDLASLDKTYQTMYQTYCSIFSRCGLKYLAVEAESGAIGGDVNHEFMVPAESGEDILFLCSTCDYGANIEKCEIGKRENISTETVQTLSEVATPGMKTVEEISAFLKTPAASIIKTLIYVADENPVVVLIRGDHDVNEIKLRKALGADTLMMATASTIEKITGGPLGFSGPVGLKETISKSEYKDTRIIADNLVDGIANAVTGANKADTHLIGVRYGRDFSADAFYDLSYPLDNDPCPRCEGTLTMKRGIEIGHIFKLGTKYSEALHATFLDENGDEKLCIMGCYGIGVNRILASAIELFNDENGIIWPPSIAPYQVVIIPIKMNDEAVASAAEELEHALEKTGFDVLIDDRDVRPGVKFKDADLIGFPVRVVIGKTFTADGTCEVKARPESQAKLIAKAAVADTVKTIIESWS